MKNKYRLLTICLASLLVSGCSSLGKGITEAILEKQEAKDTRLCEVWGEGFTGLQPHLKNATGTMKVLMVHGVGDHKPGYATEFFEKLAKELNLTVTSKAHKNIKLSAIKNPETSLGNLRIKRFLNKERNKELLLYELTWSEITAKEKEVLAYDNSGEHSFRRAEINDLLKRFSNDTGPDPIIYLGESRADILASFTQSFCWMTYGNWDELPDDENIGSCQLPDISAIINDQYAFVSHSLGSRITIDGVQLIASSLGGKAFIDGVKIEASSIVGEKNNQYNLYKTNIKKELKNKVIPIYMMSNQLPMLQLGRKLPQVSKKHEQYCHPDGENYSERTLLKTPIIAFSDPNDILSYSLPQGFVDKYLDSRLCIDVTNVNINVAFLYDIFGLGNLANPMDAHIGYDTDDRVVALIARGIGNDSAASIVKERCSWTETID